MKKIIFLLVLNLVLMGSSCVWGKLILKSTSFKNKGIIPKKFVMYTIGGQNISPEFEWKGAPKDTKSFVLIMVDTHPIANNWLHWVVINIPKNINLLNQGWSGSNNCKKCKELINSYGFKGYGGPQPPRNTGKHTYETQIYALDCNKLDIKENPTYQELIDIISPHILDMARYIGYYEQNP